MITRAQKVRLAVFFVIGFGVLLTILIILLGSRITEKRDYYQVVYHDTSVAGLQIGGAVLYRGIRIGRVEDILIDREQINNVIVKISVRRGTPIKEDMIATMVLVGITGLKQIELSGGTDEKPFLAPGGTIPAGLGLFDSIAERTEVLTLKVEKVIENLIAITDVENQQKLSNIIGNIDNIIDKANQPLSETIVHIESITAELAVTTKSINDILTQIDPQSVGRIVASADTVMSRVAAIEFDQIGQTLNVLLNRANVMLTRLDAMVQKSSPDITATLEELRETIENLNEFSRLIADDPSILIRSRRHE